MIGANSADLNSACVQGNQAERDINQRMAMDAESPVSAWQFHHTVITKTEPMDDADMVSHNEKNNLYSSSHTINRSPYYIPTSSARDFHSNAPSHFMYNHLPLTPPESEPMVSPPNQGPSPSPPSTSPKSTMLSTREPTRNVGKTVKSEPSSHSPTGEGPSTPMEYWSSQNLNGHLHNLEQTMENTVLAAQRRNSSSSGDDPDNRKSSDEDIRVPKVNSNGKLKLWKCRQCSFTAKTKVESWEHAKTHIKPEKLLECTMCPFVTEFKHHLEYHILNHTGKKPYKCEKCEYRCVNKSMLSSHAKCHSDVHQYRCANCNYVSKYCHSLKLHLRKYGHSPSKVLNPDGSENPYPIIDVYGTRRGPKMKTPSQQRSRHSPPLSHDPRPSTSQGQAQLPYGLPPQFLFPPPQLQQLFPSLQLPFVNGFAPAGLPNPVLLQNLQRLVQEKQAELERSGGGVQQSPERPSPPPSAEPDVLDLSKPGPSASKNRRKGLAFKIDDIPADSSDEDEEAERTTTMFSNVEVVHNEESVSQEGINGIGDNGIGDKGIGDKGIGNNDIGNNIGEKGLVEEGTRTSGSDAENDSNNNSKTGGYVCEPCGITFADHVLHTIHMGFHGFNDPFTCNVCGQRCKNRVDFYLHILRPRHLHAVA